MSLLDKIRGKSEADEQPPVPVEGVDTAIDSGSTTSFDATRNPDSTLAGSDLYPRNEGSSIISPAVPTEPGPNSEFAPSSTMSFAPTTQAADPTTIPSLPAAGSDKFTDLFGRHRQRVLTGLVALGFIGTFASVFLVVSSSNRSAAQVRANLTTYFVFVDLIAVGVFVARSLIGWDTVLHGICIAPFVIVGGMVGQRLFPLASETFYRRLALGLLVAIAVGVLVLRP